MNFGDKILIGFGGACLLGAFSLSVSPFALFFIPLREKVMSLEGEVIRERLGELRQSGSIGRSGGDIENYVLTIRDRDNGVYTLDIKGNYPPLRVLSQHLEIGDRVRIDLYDKLIGNIGETYSSQVHPLPKR